MCLNNVIHHSSKETKAPSDLRATNSGSTEVTLQWTKPKVTPKEDLSYTVSSIEKSSIFMKAVKEFLTRHVPSYSFIY